METKRVKAKDFEGWNWSITMFFGWSPSFEITCGNCEYEFSARFKTHRRIEAICPACNIINVLPLEVGTMAG